MTRYDELRRMQHKYKLRAGAVHREAIMSKGIAIALCLLLIGIDTSKAASGFTGEWLLQSCRAFQRGAGAPKGDPPTTFEVPHEGIACLSYLAAVIDTLNQVNQTVICKPRADNPMELLQLFVSIAQEHPEWSKHDAAAIFIAGLKERFPCRKGQ
jgi:hypothetical protein